MKKNNYFKFAEIILKKLLGYDIINDMSHEKGNIEFSFKDGEGKTVLGIEVKGTGKDLFAEQKGYKEWQKTPIHQLWNYMGELSLDYGIATNYKHFILIGRKGTSATHYFNFEEIRDDKEKLKEFIAIFSKEQIINKGFIEELEKASAIEEREFTKEFYKLFNETRLMLVKEFQENGTNKDEAIHYSQLFLNRLMFIFFAEDTHKLKARIFENSVISILKAEMLILDESHQVSNIIVNLFKSLDAGSERFSIFGFNGGLFKDEVPSNIFFNDLRDKEFFKDVYQNSKLKKEMKLDDVSKSIFDKYQNKLNPIISNLILMALFDFKTEISVNILGHVFEQSLSDLEVLKEGEVSKRKKEGVFYTPEYITDYICRNTIIPYLSKENARNPYDLILEYSSNIEDLESKLNHIKIVDPACGSGAFLIKAVDVLLELFKEIQIFKQREGAYTSVKRGRKKIKDEGQFTFEKWHEEDEAKEIIKNNIYGVDINEESVEITKLSLFLKIARSGEKLIDLSKNIKCGNSLIDDPEVDSKAFNWKQEFKEIFDKGGFDIVVGNPPYVDSEQMTKSDEVGRKFLSKEYKCTKGNWDLYIPFIEKSFDLTNEDGFVSLITPNKWLSMSYGMAIRQFLRKYLYQLSDFSSIKVFEDAGIFPIIFFVSKREKKVINIKIFSDNLLFLSRNVMKERFANFENYGVFFSDKIDLISKLINSGDNLSNICKISGAFTTSEAYDLIPFLGEDENTSKDVLKFINTGTIDRYCVLWGHKYTTYIKKKYLKPVLDIGQFKENFKNRFNKFDKPKIIITGIRHFECFYDKNKKHVAGKSTSVLIDLDERYYYEPILCILNSKLITFYLKECFSSSGMDGGINFSPSMISTIPIPEIPKNQQKILAEKADMMLKLNESLLDKKSKFLRRCTENLNLVKVSKKMDNFYILSFEDFIKELKKQKIDLSLKVQDEWEDYFNDYKKELIELKEQINKTDREIDEIVYNLYGLTEEEINIVNES